MARKPAFQFIIRPPAGRLYFIARVFKSKDDLREYTGTADAIAIVRSYTNRVTKNGKTFTSPEAGELCLCFGHLDIDTIAHECVHIAIALSLRRRKPIIGKDRGKWVSREEEEFCDLVGKLVAQIDMKLRVLELK